MLRLFIERDFVNRWTLSRISGSKGRSSSLLLALFAFSLGAVAQGSDLSMGVYAGKYYDTEPAGFTQGKADFLEHYLVAVTAKKTIWRSDAWPVSLEADGMVGYQSGVASLGEVAFAPAVRWHAFPWNDTVRTSVAFAPLGISYTTSVSPLERGSEGKGSQTLNWLYLEVALANPASKSDEFFARLHHRCAIYDLLNNYGANGEDFFTLGFRRRF
jgi:hypothetical protein